MNKTERAAMALAQRTANAAMALSWPNFPEPKPIVFAKDDFSGKSAIHCFMVNTYNDGQVFGCWRTAGTRFDRDPLNAKAGTYMGGSRESGPAYATEQEAWLVLYHMKSRMWANELAKMLERAGAMVPVDEADWRRATT